MSRLQRPASVQLRGGDLARLIKFVNSLVLNADGSLSVKQADTGTSIGLSEEERTKIDLAATPQDISATVADNTATITLSGSTSAVKIVGVGGVTISANDEGEIEINAEGGSGPLADYTVTEAVGNTNGTLFYGLSQQGDNTVSVDSSLDGTPLDFEGASVL